VKPLWVPPATLDHLLVQEKAAAQQQLTEATGGTADGATQPEQQQQEGPQQQAACHSGQMPTVQDLLAGRFRSIYGYSLAGRGLLQLLRGLPPHP